MTKAQPGAAGSPYPNMPPIAPIGERVDKYLDVPESAKGADIDPAKGYRLQELGKGLYLVTDNGYQSMFLIYEEGVVVVDAPPSYASKLRAAIGEVTDKPITQLVYSHAHADHIGGADELGHVPVIIAHDETKKLLARAKDPHRPIPTLTFSDRYTLKVGSQSLELSYHGTAHIPGNIFIYAPAQKTLMVVDVVIPGWMPWRRLSLAQDIPGYFAMVEEIKRTEFDAFVGGHVARVGTHADVELQSEFINDLKSAAAEALRRTKPIEGMDPRDTSNLWAVFDDYLDRTSAQCVSLLTPKWSTKLGGFDVNVWDQCYAMEESLRID